MPDTPRLALPFRVVGRRAVVVEQDSEAEILQCVESVLSYRRGQLAYDPDFGAPDQAHRQGGVDLAGLADPVERIEPRAHDLAASVGTDLLGLTQRVGISVGVVGGG